jgi:hypothetical protein
MVIRFIRAVFSPARLKLLPGVVAALGVVVVWVGGQWLMSYLLVLALFQRLPAEVRRLALALGAGGGWVLYLWLGQARANGAKSEAPTPRVYVTLVWWKDHGAVDIYLTACPPSKCALEEVLSRTTSDLNAGGQMVAPQDLQVIVTNHHPDAQPFRAVRFRCEHH